MFEKIKKYWLLIALAFLATILGIVWFIGQQKEAPEKQEVLFEQPIVPGVAFNQSTSFILEKDPTSTTLPVFSVTKLAPYSENEAQTIAQTFGFTGERLSADDIDDGVVYYWTQAPTSLSITPKTREVRYHKDLIESPLIEEGNFPDENQMLTAAQDLLQSLGVNPQTVQRKSRYIFLDGPDPIQGEREFSNLFEVSFYYSIENTPLILTRGESNVARFWVDKQGNLVRLDMQNIISSYKSLGSFKLKDKNEILQNLSINGRLFSTGSHGDLAVEEIRSITFGELSQEYFYDDKQSILLPLFTLKGTGIKVNGETTQASVYIPAISNSYFKN